MPRKNARPQARRLRAKLLNTMAKKEARKKHAPLPYPNVNPGITLAAILAGSEMFKRLKEPEK